MNTTEQPILCVNIAVFLHCMSHKLTVPCIELNTIAALLEEPCSHNLFFCYDLETTGLLVSNYINKNMCACVCVFQCQPTALLRASGSAQGR